MSRNVPCVNKKNSECVHTINSRSEMIAPNVIDMTGPIRGETNIAATIFGALFSTNPSAAKELFQQILHV